MPLLYVKKGNILLKLLTDWNIKYDYPKYALKGCFNTLNLLGLFFHNVYTFGWPQGNIDP